MAVGYCAMGLRGGSIVNAAPAGDSSISGSVGAGGANRNSDVMSVQSMLNRVPASSGGPLTPLKTDGLCGPLTIAAIRRFQSANFGFNDGRVDPGGKTINRLSILTASKSGSSTASGASSARSGASSFAPVSAPPAAAPTPKKTPLAAAIAAAPTAKLWTSAALTQLNGLKQGLVASGGVVFIPEMFTAVNTHFHLDRDPSSILVNFGRAIDVFNRISTVLSDPSTFFREGPETKDSHWADAPMGGFFMGEPNHNINIRTQFSDVGPNCQAAMLVHEGAHFCGKVNEIRHFAHEFPVPNGEPQDGSTHNYADMTADESLRNAASYAAFAIQAFFQQDLRFGLDKKDQ